MFLIVIDHDNKYFELAQQPNTSSDTVITRMRNIFAQYGIPNMDFVIMDHSIVHMNLRNLLNYGTSLTRLPVSSSLSVTSLWIKVFKPLRKTTKYVEKMILTHTYPYLCYAQNPPALEHPSRAADEKKVES